MKLDKKYFYSVGVYDYESHMTKDYSHNKKYNNYEFSLIVQDCIDETIMNYSKQEEYINQEPCSLDIYDVIKLPAFNMYMGKRGFKLVNTQATYHIENLRVFSTRFGSEVLRDRYSCLSLGGCHECFRDDEDLDEKCPVLNDRRG